MMTEQKKLFQQNIINKLAKADFLCEATLSFINRDGTITLGKSMPYDAKTSNSLCFIKKSSIIENAFDVFLYYAPYLSFISKDKICINYISKFFQSEINQ